MAISSSTRPPCLLFLLLLVLAGSSSSGATAATALDPAPPNRVTVITDSVGGVLSWLTKARENLARGLDLDLEAKACRKLVDPGCPQDGDPHPVSALDTIRELGPQVGSTVVIDVGYNDSWSLYGAELDKVMEALIAVGARHVVWVTLEEFRDPWIGINKAIRAAPTRWNQLIVADWAHAAADKPSWFYDGVHMNWEGGLAFADFLRPYVLEGMRCAMRAASSARDRDHPAAVGAQGEAVQHHAFGTRRRSAAELVGHRAAERPALERRRTAQRHPSRGGRVPSHLPIARLLERGSRRRPPPARASTGLVLGRIGLWPRRH